MARPLKPNEDRDRYYRDRDNQPIFDSATFNCFLNRSSMRFLQDGQMAVGFVIEADEIEKALPLRFLAANPLPVTVIVMVNDEYKRDRTTLEAI